MSDTSRLHPDQRQALKHIAIQIVALLPSDTEDATCVLAYAQELVTGFLAEQSDEKPLLRLVVPS